LRERPRRGGATRADLGRHRGFRRALNTRERDAGALGTRLERAELSAQARNAPQTQHPFSVSAARKQRVAWPRVSLWRHGVGLFYSASMANVVSILKMGRR